MKNLFQKTKRVLIASLVFIFAISLLAPTSALATTNLGFVVSANLTAPNQNLFYGDGLSTTYGNLLKLRNGSGSDKFNIDLSGNVTAFGNVTAASFYGDGSHLTNIPGTTQWTDVTGGINYSSGNVGIGSAAPGAKLDVVGTVRANTLDLSPSGGTFTIGSSQINRTDGNVELQWAGGQGVRMFGNTAYPIEFSGTGKVGIGTTNPTMALTIGTLSPQAAVNGVFSGINGAKNFFEAYDGSKDVIFGADPGISYGKIGTLGAADFAIVTNNDSTKGIYVKNGGNVGIGTTGPLSSLNSTLTTIGTGIFQTTASGNYNENLRLNRNSNNNYASLILGGAYNSTSGTGAGQWALYTYPNSGPNPYGLQIDYNGTSPMSITTGGNVGIGTNAPGGLLDVNGRARATSLAVWSSFSDLTNNSPWYGIGESNITFSGQAAPAVQVAGYFGLNFVTSGGSVMSINNGNVGIGTTNPYATLDVHGATNANLLSYGSSGQTYFTAVNDANNANVPLSIYGLPIALMGGNVGIGTNAPSYPLTLYNASGETGILTTYGSTNVFLSHGGWSMGAGKFGIGNGTVPTIVVYTTANGGTSAGNVGIGTTAPNRHLTVSGAGAQWISVVNTDAGYTAGIEMKSNGNVGGSTIADNNKDLTFTTSDGGQVMTIKDGGSVGIGTTAPGAKLDVEGGANGIYGAGSSWGVYGYSNSGTGIAGTGSTAGVTATGGAEGIAATGNTYGVLASGGTYGVYGSGSSYGIYGNTSNTTGIGVYGISTANGNQTYGVMGFSTGSGGAAGVEGVNNSTDTNSYGVYGLANGGIGVEGAGGTYGVYGYSSAGWAGYFQGNSYFSNGISFGGTSAKLGKINLLQASGNAIDWINSNGSTITSTIFDDGDLHIRTDDNFWIDSTAGTNEAQFSNGAYKFQVNGSALAVGSWTTSDIRWKKDIAPLQNSLDKIMALQGVNYYWDTKDYPKMGFTDDKQIGFIAQDVKKVVPELVMTDSNGYESVDYGKVTPVIVEAIKEQQAQIETLKTDNQNLQAQVDSLSSRLSAIEAKMGIAK